MMKAPKMDKWQAETDCHTLMEAAEIRKDKSRLRAAVAYAKKAAAQLKEVHSG